MRGCFVSEPRTGECFGESEGCVCGEHDTVDTANRRTAPPAPPAPSRRKITRVCVLGGLEGKEELEREFLEIKHEDFSTVAEFQYAKAKWITDNFGPHGEVNMVLYDYFCTLRSPK